jgi:ribose 5-phosphate isomerase
MMNSMVLGGGRTVSSVTRHVSSRSKEAKRPSAVPSSSRSTIATQTNATRPPVEKRKHVKQDQEGISQLDSQVRYDFIYFSNLYRTH